ncbi:MAG TPA: FAD-dependent oxidoreductase [Syntrophorhabdaceae bacterium]|nr:FAD-dependent oxidoreductase [Syntrophorhabdaceae bacterium]
MDYIILGNGIAGIQGALNIRRYDREGDITIITDEEYGFYSRPMITDIMTGKRRPEEIILMGEEGYRAFGFKFMKGLSIKRIDLEKRCLYSSQDRIKFHRLLIATGARPKRIKKHRDGVYYLRSIKDALDIKRQLKNTKKAIVYGGGPVGIKAAYALLSWGMPVSIVVTSPQIMSRVFDKKTASVFQRLFEENGARFYLGSSIEDLVWQKGLKGVVTDRGDYIDGGILIVGKGVVSHTEIAEDAGISVNEGIIVNDMMETSEDGIYAAGDVAETNTGPGNKGRVFALWHTGAEQGKVAGANMAGEKKIYSGSVSSNSVEYFGMKAISMGTMEGEGLKEEIYEDKDGYRRFMFRDELLVGAILVGNIQGAGILLNAIKKGTPRSIWERDFLSSHWPCLSIHPNITMEVLF